MFVDFKKKDNWPKTVSLEILPQAVKRKVGKWAGPEVLLLKPLLTSCVAEGSEAIAVDVRVPQRKLGIMLLPFSLCCADAPVKWMWKHSVRIMVVGVMQWLLPTAKLSTDRHWATDHLPQPLKDGSLDSQSSNQPSERPPPPASDGFQNFDSGIYRSDTC